MDHVTNAELRARARAQLGGAVLNDNWMYAVLTVLIVGLVTAAAEAVSSVLAPVAAVVLLGPLTYSTSVMFLKQARDGQKMELADLLLGFKNGMFGSNVLLGFLMGLLVMLWSLLLLVPGIIKAYGWSMAYYIHSDNPELGAYECMKESEYLMKGHKMELFLLDLSFIGWAIVGVLAFGIGTLWVEAYNEAAHAQFFQNLVEQQAQGYSAVEE